ncbi:hypothetical protein NA57DRAFT_51776 [Rhizodiscina lignyota]|uniref:Xylanolytic transcriptional activator regulatory domain-containing protein n=1 Tax=Rhizodiscina lignyota TaxID=1504668 RepID=A0A9P4ISD9_9PEZI|nr:hypothetical protein NA57DRAFT_51776 [Rhizodiscina lignyota]
MSWKAAEATSMPPPVCSGEEPCKRCAHHGHQCFYSEDRAAAEILHGIQSFTNGSHAYIPRISRPDSEGRSDGRSRWELRLERVETMLEKILASLRQDSSLRASAEPEAEQSGANAVDFQGDTAFRAPINTFNANLASVRLQLGLPEQQSQPPSPATVNPHESPHQSIRTPTNSLSKIRVGLRSLPFPTQEEYRRYIKFFFDDINPCHPCVNEADFEVRSEKLLSSLHRGPIDTGFLALNYIIFACTDILTNITPSEQSNVLPGWDWYLAADSLLGKRKFGGRANLTVIQFLIFEAFYLVHADKGNAAYNVIGLACRLCFQLGLHQQSRWAHNQSAYWRHMNQRIFWTVYFTDRRISLSCGRPYGIHDSETDVEEPEWISDRALHPDRPFPDPDHVDSFNMYLSCMVAWAKLAGQVFFVSASNSIGNDENIAILDAKIRHWAETILANIPLLPPPGVAVPSLRHLRQRLLVNTDQHFAYAESFRGAAQMLQNLAVSLQAARRIQDDLRDITHVVTSLLNQEQASEQDLMSLLPQNIDHLFPYGAIDFAQQFSPWPHEIFSDRVEINVHTSTDSTFDPDALGTLDPWDNALQSNHGYGVPWI